jgi:hypothetical protein
MVRKNSFASDFITSATLGLCAACAAAPVEYSDNGNAAHALSDSATDKKRRRSAGLTGLLYEFMQQISWFRFELLDVQLLDETGWVADVSGCRFWQLRFRADRVAPGCPRSGFGSRAGHRDTTVSPRWDSTSRKITMRARVSSSK